MRNDGNGVNGTGAQEIGEKNGRCRKWEVQEMGGAGNGRCRKWEV